MVRDMFRKYNEGYGNVCHSNRSKVRCIKFVKSVAYHGKRKIRHIKEGFKSDFSVIEKAVLYAFEIHDYKLVNVCCLSDCGKDHCTNISGKYTENKRNKLSALFAVYRAEHYGGKSYQTAKYGNTVICA